VKKLKKISKIKKVYPKTQCMYVGSEGQCTEDAVGKSTLCEDHGGEVIIKENLVTKYDPLGSALYKPEYHPMQFITLSREGMSPVEIAAEFQVGIKSINKWQEKYLEFNTAYEVGLAIYEAWWLAEARGNLGNSRYNTSLFKYITGNKLGYAEKMESKNLNMSIHGVMVVPDKVSEAEWEEEAIQHGKDNS